MDTSCRGQVSINTSEMPFVLAGHRAPRVDLLALALSPSPLGHFLELSAGRLRPDWSLPLFPSVLCMLIKTEASLSLYPPWTILGDKAWQGAGDQVHVCLGSALKARASHSRRSVTVYLQPLEAAQSSAVWVGPQPTKQAGDLPPKAGALPWQLLAKLLPRQGKYTSLPTPTHTHPVQAHRVLQQPVLSGKR